MKPTCATVTLALGVSLLLAGATAQALAPIAGFGGALQFDGVSNHVVVADHADLCLTNNYTIEAWIRPHSFGWLRGIVSKYNSSGANGFTLRLSMNSPYTGINFDDVDTGTGFLGAGKWSHVAAVNSNGIRTVYIDGVPRASDSGPYNATSNSDPVIIGADFYPAESDRLFNGAIDEVRIWAAVLSPSTITNWMFREVDSKHPAYSALAAYYRLNDGSGLTAADSSGKVHPGALSNMSAAAWIQSDVRHWYVNAGGSVTGQLVGSFAGGSSTDGTNWTLPFEMTTQTLQGVASLVTNNVFIYMSTSTVSGIDRLPYRCLLPPSTWSSYATAVVHVAGFDPVTVITSRFGVLQPSVTSVSIGGTNNAGIVGQMWWTNELVATSGTFAAATAWNVPDVPLAYGENPIIVRGSNLANFVAESRLTILRAEPDMLETWDFAGNTGNEVTVPASYSAQGIAGGVIGRGSALYPALEPDSYFSTNWPCGSSSSGFMEFAVAPYSGNFCSITSISVALYRRDYGDVNYTLRSDRDGFTAALASGYFFTDVGTSRWETIDLSGRPEFNPTATTIVFRLYGSACSGGPDAGLKRAGADVVVRGSVWPDPWGFQGKLLSWDFAGKAGNEATVGATTVSSGLVTTAVSRGPGITAVARMNTFNATNWLYGSFQPDDFFQFAIQPRAGFRYAITGVTYRVRLYDTYYSFDYMDFILRSDRDSYVGDLDSSRLYNVDPPTGGVLRTVAVTSAGFDGVSTTVTFRLYGYNLSTGPDAGLGGTGDDLTLWGRVWFDRAGDDDGDGMPNEWEFVNTGTATGAVPGVDVDGDRFTDDQEWVAGTKPRDSNSFLRVTRIVRTNSYTLTFPCVTDRVYSIEAATNLPDPTAWSALPDLTNRPGAAAGTMSLTDTNTAARCNYRVGVSFPLPPVPPEDG